MIWPEEFDILQHVHRDAKVLFALKKTVTITTETQQLTTASKKAVDETLASIFSDALHPTVLQILTEQHRALDFLTALQLYNPLAAKLGERTFFRLFGVLVEARLAWKTNPRMPFDVNQHCLLAKSIDGFLQQAPSWTNAELDIYEAVGGYDSEDDDGGENEPDESMSGEQAVEAARMAMERMEVDNEEKEEGGEGQDHPVEKDDEGYAEAVDEITRGMDYMDIDE